MTVEWLVADTVWWEGRLRAGAGLRVGDGPSALVEAAHIPRDALRRRLPGTLLPGLLDSHVHSALADLRTVRSGGIAAVWDLGGVPAVVGRLAARSARQASGLPRVWFAGPFMSAAGGYPSDRTWAPPGSCRAVRSVGDAGEAVDEAAGAGATLIKATAHAGLPQLGPAVLAALVESAHAAGLPVVVHAEGPGTVASAVDGGADMLAHTPWTESLDEGLVRAAAGMTWLSTLDIHGWGEDTREWHTAVGNLRRFLGHGGTVRYGTDLGNGPLPAGVNAREIRALQAAGLSSDEVLTAMTGDAGPHLEVAESGLYPDPCWIPAGLDLHPDRFADALATATVVGPEGASPRSAPPA